jgi:hypothetical protein
MKFMVRYVGRIIESKRPAGFPKEVYTDIGVKSDSRDRLKETINDFLALLVSQQGMVVEKPKNFDSYSDLQPDFKDLDTRIFVPYHMFAYIETVSKLVSAKTEPESRGDEDETPEEIVLN